MLNKIKSHFFVYGGLSGNSLIYMVVIIIYLLFAGVNKYERWSCGNYEMVTGFESKYIEWEHCYIKGSDGVFIRYDEKHKSVDLAT